MVSRRRYLKRAFRLSMPTDICKVQGVSEPSRIPARNRTGKRFASQRLQGVGEEHAIVHTGEREILRMPADQLHIIRTGEFLLSKHAQNRPDPSFQRKLADEHPSLDQLR